MRAQHSHTAHTEKCYWHIKHVIAEFKAIYGCLKQAMVKLLLLILHVFAAPASGLYNKPASDVNAHKIAQEFTADSVQAGMIGRKRDQELRKRQHQIIAAKMANHDSSDRKSSRPDTPKGAQKAIAIRKNANNNCYNSMIRDGTAHPFLAELLEAAESKQGVGKRIILTGGDGNYRGVVMNWMALMDNINVRDYIVLCFNETLFDVVGSWKEGGHGIMVSGCISFQEMAFMKFIAMNVLVRAGYVTTWSDSDCIWLKDFFPQWIDPYASKVDMIGQRGGYPIRFVKLIGVSICTGLMTFFPTTKAISIFEKLLLYFELRSNASQYGPNGSWKLHYAKQILFIQRNCRYHHGI
jgi:hypothetical protein